MQIYSDDEMPVAHHPPLPHNIVILNQKSLSKNQAELKTNQSGGMGEQMYRRLQDLVVGYKMIFISYYSDSPIRIAIS